MAKCADFVKGRGHNAALCVIVIGSAFNQSICKYFCSLDILMLRQAMDSKERQAFDFSFHHMRLGKDCTWEGCDGDSICIKLLRRIHIQHLLELHILQHVEFLIVHSKLDFDSKQCMWQILAFSPASWVITKISQKPRKKWNQHDF